MKLLTKSSNITRPFPLYCSRKLHFQNYFKLRMKWSITFHRFRGNLPQSSVHLELTSLEFAANDLLHVMTSWLAELPVVNDHGSSCRRTRPAPRMLSRNWFSGRCEIGFRHELISHSLAWPRNLKWRGTFHQPGYLVCRFKSSTWGPR